LRRNGSPRRNNASPSREIEIRTNEIELVPEPFEREIDKHWKIMETAEGQADFANWTKLLQLADKLTVCYSSFFIF
jgi:hypothetical protein